MNATATAEAAFEAAKKAFSNIPGLEDLKFEHLPQWAIDHIKEHPYMTAIEVIGLLMGLFPGAFTAPGLLAVGFGRLGPLAGRLAPLYQAAKGTPWLFRTLQSAGMGGKGAAIVNGATQGAGVAAGFLAEVGKRFNGTAA